MGLNIKNERVCALAKRVAAESGQTQTGAIESALERYLEQLLADTEEARRAAVASQRKARLERTLTLIDAERDPNAPSVEQIMDEMYDELGLPR